jgi:hypothetical protein
MDVLISKVFLQILNDSFLVESGNHSQVQGIEILVFCVFKTVQVFLLLVIL